MRCPKCGEEIDAVRIVKPPVCYSFVCRMWEMEEREWHLSSGTPLRRIANKFPFLDKPYPDYSELEKGESIPIETPPISTHQCTSCKREHCDARTVVKEGDVPLSQCDLKIS